MSTQNSSDTNIKKEISNFPLLLNWHKVQIYGLLFAVALLYIASSIPLFTNTFYGKDTEFIYTICEPLNAIDKLFGLFSLVYAAFLIYLRFQLAQYKRKALFYMDVAYIMPGIFNMTYQFLSSLVVHKALNMTFGEIFNGLGVVLFLMSCVIATILNHVYYSKRYELFVN